LIPSEISSSSWTSPVHHGEVVIRPFRAPDREAVLAIDFETGFLGSSMHALIDTPEMFTRGLDWYLRRYASHCFVAETRGTVGGYVVAAPEEIRLRFALATLSGLLGDLTRLRSLTPRDRRYLASRLRTAAHAVRGEERRFRPPYGARLHINLLPGLRSGGIGSLLLETLFARLRTDGVTRVHANSYQSMSNQTEGFWHRNGFEEHSRVRSSVWSEFVADEVDLVCYVRDLS
jgi:GNAT superfamily N-acetyltransferase